MVICITSNDCARTYLTSLTHWLFRLFLISCYCNNMAKINKQILYLKWSWEARSENSQSWLTQCTLLTPIGRDIACISDRK